MNKLVVWKYKIAAALALVVIATGFSQEKFVESYDASDAMVVTVNTSHTNVIFETWNKDSVAVEAFIEGAELSKKEKQQLFDDWKFNVLGNSKNVVITSNGKNSNWEGLSSLSSLESLGSLDFLGPLLENALAPVINGVTSPEFTETILRSVSNIDFDYEEYKKDEEGYMKKFEAKMDKNLGKDFERDMEKWGANLEKEYQERFGPEWEAKMEAWQAKLGKDMEHWGAQFGKEMEAWGAQFGQNFGENMEERIKEMEEAIERGMTGGNSYKQTQVNPDGNSKTTIITNDGNYTPKVKRTILIRMPKHTKTEINVRHGEIKMADAFNVKATLNHAPFTAERIDGGKTLINASYAPLVVKEWMYGTLYVKFVEKCEIGTVESIQLNANSSDVRIDKIEKEAFLTGSFGALIIGDISNNFQTLEIVLRNTDAAISLPNTSFSFLFNGKRSTLKYPKSLQLNSEKQEERVFVTGFNRNAEKNRNFRVNAEYSNLILQ